MTHSLFSSLSNEPDLIINTDGGSRGNPGEAATGYVIKDTAGNVQELCGKYIGVATNNVAEYQAVKEAYIKLLERWGYRSREVVLKFLLDSQLVVNQLNGNFKIKNQNLLQRVRDIRKFEQNFKQVSYNYIPREKNSEADSLVNKALDERTT